MTNETEPRDLSWFFEHIVQYSTDPVRAHDWDAATNPQATAEGLHPTLLLTTRGRRSGENRSIPLLYQPCGEGFVVVASKGGTDEDPEWYKNLLAEPQCQVVAGCLTCKATANVLTGERRMAYWRWMVRFWPDYELYQSRTLREIPVVVLAINEVTLADAQKGRQQ